MKKSLFLLVFLILFAIGSVYSQDTPLAKKAIASGPTTSKTTSPPLVSSKELTVDQIVQLVQAGLSEDIIVAKIKKNGKAFDPSANQLIQLKNAKASDNIILVMMDPQAQPLPKQLPQTETTSTTVSVKDSGPRESPKTDIPNSSAMNSASLTDLPTGIGVFYKRGQTYEEIPGITVEGNRGKAGFMTGGIMRFKTKFKAPGRKSKLVIPDKGLNLLVHIPGQDPTKLQLISMLEIDGNERLLFSVEGRIGNNVKINSIPSSLKDLGNGYVEISPKLPLASDEYAVVIYEPSTSALSLGAPAKAWDFSVTPAK